MMFSTLQLLIVLTSIINMTLLTVTNFKGLNKRDSDIVRNPEYASDLQNVLLNNRRELIKRYGFTLTTTPGFSLLDIMEYKTTSELIGVRSTGLYKLSAGSFQSINLAGSAPAGGWGGVDFDQYNNSLYFTDIAGNTDLFKYDGYAIYRAGIPQVYATTATGAGAKYYRLAYYFIDAQGAIHWGDYLQFDSLAAGASFTVNTFNGTEYYAKGAISSGAQTINAGNLTANVNAGHNYVAGDFIRGLDSTDNRFKMLEVDSVTATTVVFTAGSVGAGSFSYGAAEQLERRVHCAIFISDYATWGYYQDATVSHLNGSIATQVVTSTGATAVPMEDIYDSTLIKGLPPKCKYVKIYGRTMVLGNKINEQQSSTDLTDYTKSQIAWSDTGVGSSVETFPPFNRQQIGKTSEGEISGLFASDNELIILKEFQIYYIHGILIDRAFRLTSALSGGIGCTSHRSIVEAENGCFFQSEKGVYYVGGGRKPIEISDLIEPIFTNDTTGLDLTRCRAIRDTKNELIMFYIPATLTADDIVLVYDYYYKEWFLFKGYDADGGFCISNNVIYHSNGTSLYTASSSYSDNGSAINAFYRTGYYHFGMPSLLKKFIRAVVMSIGSLSWVCNLKTQKDYGTTDDTDSSISFSSSVIFEDKPLNLSNCYSMRFEFANNVNNEGMLVSAYEIEYAQNQRAVKGES